MKYIIDTHILLWFLDEPEKLPDNVLRILKYESDVAVSIVSLWEIGIKQRLHKIEWEYTSTEMALLCEELHFKIIPISPMHIDRILEMPLIHKDPFDRMIIAQAQTENLTIITHDSMIPLYDVNILQ
ncbi:MAG: type II toxin-antitoxin system VapC family toxin [Spirochaetales bacterium]|nr:type II toxin-antitoxin system VapC family toxin [Spirochaetales bacterium]